MDSLPHPPSAPAPGPIRILVVDDYVEVREYATAMLAEFPLYDVNAVSTAAGAACRIADKAAPVHVCLLDLGLADIQGDQFYLLRRYALRTAFIIVTGSGNAEDGYRARELGAVGLLLKPVSFISLPLHSLIAQAFLKAALGLLDTANLKPTLLAVSEVLLNRTPSTVQRWSEQCGVTHEYLRRLCLGQFGVPPGQALGFVHSYQRAFSDVAQRIRSHSDPNILLGPEGGSS